MGFGKIEMDMFGNRSRTIILALLLTAQAQAGQLYYSPVTVNSGQVPSTQTDFPMLVSYTDARFKTIGNGGHVNNASGYDIRPYSDSTLTTALTYELERYNATTGEVVMWVKIGSIADASVVYLGYGDTGISTDGSSGTNTFSNSFLAVYHLKDGTTLSLADSLAAFSLNGVNTPTAVAGKVDGGVGLASASNQYAATSANGPAAVAVTISAWVNGTSFPNDYNTIWSRGSAGTDQYNLSVKSNGKLLCLVNASNTRVYDGTGTNTLSTGTWYYLTMSYDSTAGLIGKVNAGSDGTQTANGNASTTAVGAELGRQRSTTSRHWNGSIDEVRVSSTARSANWITTEYNNQNAPSTFATLGTEVGITATQRGWFMFLKK